MTVWGTIKEVPEGKTVSQSRKSVGGPILITLLPQAPGGHELAADYWELVGSSPAGGAENLVNEESHIDVQLDQRHMMLRGDTVREKESEGGREKKT